MNATSLVLLCALVAATALPASATAQTVYPGESYYGPPATATGGSISTDSHGNTYSISKCGNLSDRVLLSYDDWSYGNPSRIVSQARLLKEKNVGGLFFPIRQYYVDHLNRTGVNLVTRVRDQSQYIGNHTWSHPNLAQSSSATITDQIARGAGGRSGASGYMRPPYGAYNSTVRSIAEGMNYHVCTWTLDTADYTGKTAGQICNHVLTNARPGSVVLMHLQTKAYDATNCIIDGLRAKDIRLCRPYKVDGQFARSGLRAPYPLPC